MITNSCKQYKIIFKFRYVSYFFCTNNSQKLLKVTKKNKKVQTFNYYQKNNDSAAPQKMERILQK